MQSEAVNSKYDGNVAYDLSRFDNRRYVREALANEEVVTPEMPKAHARAKAEAKPKTRFHVSAFAVVSYVVVLALALGIVMNYMTLNEIAVDTANMESELSTLKSDGAKLTVEYERAMNVGDLADKAAAAGLYAPSADQISYIDISRADQAEVYSESGSDGLLEGIQRFFLAVSGYFQ